MRQQAARKLTVPTPGSTEVNAKKRRALGHDFLRTTHLLETTFNRRRRRDAFARMHTEDQKHAYVLGVCKHVEVEFTLREIVARIVNERPEMILEFAQVWGQLIRDEAIALCHSGKPNTYRLTRRRRLPTMELEEDSLRSALRSPGAEAFGNSILDAVARRQGVRITMNDGRKLRLTDVSDSLNTLREKFGWKPGV